MHRRRPAVLIAMLVTALAGGGCAPGGAPSGGGAGADPDRLRLAMLQPPRSGLSPLSDDAFKLSRWSTAETLVALDDDGAAVPALATSWERTDARTWRLEVRDGVTFHDGTALTAERAVASIDAAAQASPPPRILDGVRLTARAVDEDTLEVTTATPDPLLPQRLSSPQLAVLSAAAYDGPSVDPVGTGTGPFELTEVDGTSGATLERWDGYWGNPARLEGIDVAYVPDGTARAAALRTGEADVVEAVPVGQAPQLDQDLLHEVPMPRTNTLYLNTDRGPFADPAVRAAAREAVDRARVVASVYEGRADVAEGLLGPAVAWAAPLREAPSYAATLAGRAEPARRVDGVRISLGTFTDRAELPEVAVLLEQQLEAAGFEVEQDVREYQYVEADALDGAFDAFVLSRATVLDSGDPVAYLASDFTCRGSFNLSQLCDPAVDRAVRRAAALPVGEQRRRATLQAEAAVLATDAVVPMLHERVLQGESPRVGGVLRDPRERALVTAATVVK